MHIGMIFFPYALCFQHLGSQNSKNDIKHFFVSIATEKPQGLEFCLELPFVQWDLINNS